MSYAFHKIRERLLLSFLNTPILDTFFTLRLYRPSTQKFSRDSKKLINL